MYCLGESKCLVVLNTQKVLNFFQKNQHRNKKSLFYFTWELGRSEVKLIVICVVSKRTPLFDQTSYTKATPPQITKSWLARLSKSVPKIKNSPQTSSYQWRNFCTSGASYSGNWSRQRYLSGVISKINRTQLKIQTGG